MPLRGWQHQRQSARAAEMLRPRLRNSPELLFERKHVSRHVLGPFSWCFSSFQARIPRRLPPNAPSARSQKLRGCNRSLDAPSSSRKTSRNRPKMVLFGLKNHVSKLKKNAKTMPKQAIWHAETPPVRRPVQQTQRLRPRLMRQHAVVVDHLFGTTRAENASVSHRNASVFIGKRLRKGEMSSHFSYFFHDSS